MKTKSNKTTLSCKTHANDNSTGIITNDNHKKLRNIPSFAMMFEGETTSTEAAQLADLICSNLFSAASGKQLIGLRLAVGAILYDCLRASGTVPVTPLFRPMNSKSFNGYRVGYRAAQNALRGMVGAGLLGKAGGNYEREEGFGQGTVTRFWPTVELIDEMTRFGLHAGEIDRHFVRVPNRLPSLPPILLNAAKKRRGNRMPKGDPMRVNYLHPKVARYAAQVERITAYTARATFTGMTFVGFQRLFNLGDDPAFDWNKGARLWERGGYQQLPRIRRGSYTGVIRSEIKINGSKTVEVDIGSSHLTIFLHKHGIAFDPTVDLYRISGFKRDIVKKCVNLCLSEPRIPTRWPDDMKKDYLEKNGYPIDRDHSFKTVREACFDLYPILHDREKYTLTWADLQFIESEAVINAVDRLNVEYGIVALPVHDSLIVAEENRETAIYVLKDEFQKSVGVIPRVD
ncbi:hypothetical protein [uncultured Sphingomonas sp.]|uniref:hypothetical protein n=1 Tax=uncultured Sphingomonas sp. TaxID=158754 RepID=UPI0037487172